MSTQPETLADRMKRVGRRMIDECVNEHDVDVMDDLYTPDAVWHGPGGRELTGLSAIKEMVAGYLTAFPDTRMTLVHQIAEGDLLATAWRARGTHDGPLEDLSPTGRKVDLTGHIVARFEGGKIAEEWEVFDELAMLRQIGAVSS